MTISKAKLGSFDDLLKDCKLEVKTIAQKLRKLVFEEYPEACEVVRLGDSAASYGIGLKKNSESHVYIMPKPSYVNLGFFYGSNLSDPNNLLEGTGKMMRHVKIYSLKDIENPALRTLMLEALLERKKALGK